MNILRLLLSYSRGLVALGLLIGLASGLTYTGLIALSHKALERGVKTSGADLLAWAFLGLCLLMPITRTLAQLLLAQLGQRALADLRVGLSRKLLASPLRHLEEIGSHRIMATLTSDAASISNALTGIPLFCMHFTIVLGCMAYMAWLSWPLFLGIWAAMLVGLGSYQFGMRRGSVFMKKARELQDRLFTHFRAVTDGAKELKLHHDRRKDFIEQDLQVTAGQYRDRQVSAVARFALAGSFLNLIYFAALGVLLFVAPRFMSIDMTLLTGYILVLLFMAISIDVVMQLVPNLIGASIALSKIERLGLSLDKEQESLELIAPPKPTWKTLSLLGVSHTYHGEEERQFTLGPLDLTLEHGELLFLTGGNGSGKTTLAKILTGLYAPEQGEIRFDGKAVTDANREHYRQHFSAVFSDFYLFDRFLGLEGGDLDQRATDYLATLQLDKKVEVVDGALSAIDLSQGQRKRLALLTAYLEDRPIYLFDEWAADQDPQFKKFFYLELLPRLKAAGKTVVVISHDDGYYHVADRVVKLDYGQIRGELEPSTIAMLSEPAVSGS